MARTPTSSCGYLLEQLSAFIDADLSAAECRKIQRHSRTCARCASMIDELRAAMGVCRNAAAEPLPASVRRRAEARVRELMGRRRAAMRARVVPARPSRR
jgi:anti-sigma factor RsiW